MILILRASLRLTLVFTIVIGNKHEIILTLCYRSPVFNNPQAFIDSLATASDLLSDSNVPSFFCGDLNINIIDSEKRSTLDYLTAIRSASLEFCYSSPTRVTNESATCIDHFARSCMPINSVSCILETAISDHYLTLLSVICDSNPVTLGPPRTYLKTDWNAV